MLTVLSKYAKFSLKVYNTSKHIQDRSGKKIYVANIRCGFGWNIEEVIELRECKELKTLELLWVSPRQKVAGSIPDGVIGIFH